MNKYCKVDCFKNIIFAETVICATEFARYIFWFPKAHHIDYILWSTPQKNFCFVLLFYYVNESRLQVLSLKQFIKYIEAN